jgi:hypothetical protein
MPNNLHRTRLEDQAQQLHKSPPPLSANPTQGDLDQADSSAAVEGLDNPEEQEDTTAAAAEELDDDEDEKDGEEPAWLRQVVDINRNAKPADRQWLFVDEQNLLRFYPPAHPTAAQRRLVADIVALDHRSLQTLGPRNRQREEVLRLLYNAVISGVVDGDAGQGKLLFDRAESSYAYHLQTRNRLRYLLGMVVGIVGAALIGWVLLQMLPLRGLLRPELLILILAFAGMGSLTSVLTRLSSIDLHQESDQTIVVMSGAARPIVAIVFSVVVALLLASKILNISFGSATGDEADAVYVIAAFLSGFSERFAEDIIARAGVTLSSDASGPAAK